MPERRRRPNLDEKFQIETDDPEDSLRRLLQAGDVPIDEDEMAEGEDS